jgi:hypothetical protein
MYLTGTGCHPQSIILSRLVDTFKAAVFSIKFYIIYPGHDTFVDSELQMDFIQIYHCAPIFIFL